MPVPEKDRDIIRSLAARVAEIAASPEQQETRELWRRLNRLEPVRPLVQLHNATWHETGSEITLECEDEWARGQEWGLRAQLYHHEHMRDDTVYEGRVYSPLHVSDSGWGLPVDATRPDHVFGACMYHSAIPDGAEPEAFISPPEVRVDWAATERTFDQLSELYDGVLPVEKRGVAGHWFSIVDSFIQSRTIEQTFVDMVDRPEWVHAWMDRMTEWNLSRLEQLEALGGLSLNNGAVHVGPGGLGITDELPQPDFDGRHVRAVDQWGHATTQIFSEVSPAMHDEFGLTYEARFLERFGLAGYGCCEPLDRKVDLIRSRIPNLRRLSMSPWVDPARGAEAMGRDLIFSWKPNPAMIGTEAWNEEYVRGEIASALEQTRGCVVEVLMKDLHTCRGEPWRMWEWVRIAMELAEAQA